MSEEPAMKADCVCEQESPPPEGPLVPNCTCPRDKQYGVVIHEETCLLYKHDTVVFPHDPTCECVDPPNPDGTCKCCRFGPPLCKCRLPGSQAVDEWRFKSSASGGAAVLEPTHPLMQKFQESLKKFLEKENELAENEIKNLRDDLKLAKQDYDAQLESIYRSDHDTNAQRVLIQEYEQEVEKKAQLRREAEEKARMANENYKKVQEAYNQEMIAERNSREEMECLTALVRQLEQWREETESDLTINQHVSDKMKKQKKAIADEKRQLDMVVFGLNNEIWKLESKLELFKKQIEIKNNEMVKVSDKVTAYSTEMEDLEMDRKRLMSLWNSVLSNIRQRDRVLSSVREDYNTLRENYFTLVHNLEITKKVLEDEMRKSKEIAMNNDKIQYQFNAISKIFEAEDDKRVNLEQQIEQLKDAIFMNEKEQEMLKVENSTMGNHLERIEKEYNRRCTQKLQLENDILANFQEVLLNTKAVESMANGIRKMRDMSRTLEISLMKMENQHAKMTLDIEIYRNRQIRNQETLEKSAQKIREGEKELDDLQESYDRKSKEILEKQREMSILQKKYNVLKDVMGGKSPQELRIADLERQIREMRDRTETLQDEWMRLQGHVVKLTNQYHKTVADIGLINKQIQICEQKNMRNRVELEKVQHERLKVERALRDLRGQLQVLESKRKEANELNQATMRYNNSLTFEYSASLKDAESQLFDIEEEIEKLERDKVNLTQDLDRVQREALVWQRKGILAVELKRNIKDAKSATGEIGQMKHEIHRMEVRREQLRKTGEKLSDDLALYVTRREIYVDKSRALAAMDAARGTMTKTSHTFYKHRLRLLKSDVARLSKDIADCKQHLKELQQEYTRLEEEAATTSALNSQLEEQVATLIKETQDADRNKQWVLERVIRSQRLGSELVSAVKRQNLKIRKSKDNIVKEYELATKLNDRIQFIVESLVHDYPHLKDQFEGISNTLNIFSPSNSPRLTSECPVRDLAFPVPPPGEDERTVPPPEDVGN